MQNVIILKGQVRDKRSASQEVGNLKNQLFEFLFQESVLPDRMVGIYQSQGKTSPNLFHHPNKVR
jgi:hypothetical protein